MKHVRATSSSLTVYFIISILESIKSSATNRSQSYLSYKIHALLKHSFIVTIMQLYRPFPHNEGGVSRGLVCVGVRGGGAGVRGGRGEPRTDVTV